MGCQTLSIVRVDEICEQDERDTQREIDCCTADDLVKINRERPKHKTCLFRPNVAVCSFSGT
jgi:hypothetical protein